MSLYWTWRDAMRKGRGQLQLYVDPERTPTPVRVFPADDPYGLKEGKMSGGDAPSPRGFHTEHVQIIKDETVPRAGRDLRFPPGAGIFLGWLAGTFTWLIALLLLVALMGCGGEALAPTPIPEPVPECVDLEGVYNSVEYGGTTYTSFQLLVNVDPNELIGRNTIPGLLAPFSAGFVLTDDGELLWTYVNGGSQTNMWLFRDVTLRLECDGIAGYYDHAATPVLKFRK